jgi:fructose/tagatose bisphosphate aldolase
MIDLVGKAYRKGHAVPAFCAWNAEVIEAVLAAAEKMRAPVILMSGPGEFPVLPPAVMSAVSYALAARHDVPAALHWTTGIPWRWSAPAWRLATRRSCWTSPRGRWK